MTKAPIPARPTAWRTLAARLAEKRRIGKVIKTTDLGRQALVEIEGEPVAEMADVPNGLWLFPGNRVALYRYPTGWAVVGGLTDHPGLSDVELRNRARSA